MNQALKAFQPLLVLIAILMILSGAALALCYGYAAWQVLYKPEKVTVLTYILQNIADTTNVPAMTATVEGKTAVYNISPSVKMYGLCYLFIAGMGMLISVARCMSDIGVHIIKALWPAAPPPRKNPPVAGAAPKPRAVNDPPAL